MTSATTPPAPAAAPAEDGAELASEQTPGLGRLLAERGISLVVSTYQAGRLVLVRAEDEVVNTHYRESLRPMGLAVAPGQLAVGVVGEILFYADVKANCARLEPAGKHDACYVQRYGHITGEIDVHEMAFGGDGRIWFINTRFSALCTIHGTTSFAPAWKPSFISGYSPDDRCHLNGLGMVNGMPRFVTALGESDKPAGWRDNKASGGILIDLATDKVLCRGLSMPHSPRWYADRLWVCESGKGTLGTVDPATGEVQAFFRFPGFTRGLDFHGSLAFVGLSEVRESATFSGIPLTSDEDSKRNCGVWIVDISTGELVGILRFTSGVHEIFAVQVLEGVRYPELLDKKETLALQTYFLPPETAGKVQGPPGKPASA